MGYIKERDTFGKKIGKGKGLKSTLGGIVSLGFHAYSIYLLSMCLIPIYTGEILKSVATLKHINVTESFDPIDHGFNFAIGFWPPLPTGIGNLNMTYTTVQNHESPIR